MLGLKFAVFVRSMAELGQRCPTRGQTMPAGGSRTSTHKSPTNDAVVVTAGCIFPDGVIDLMASLQAQSGFLGRESGKDRAEDSPWRPLVPSTRIES